MSDELIRYDRSIWTCTRIVGHSQKFGQDLWHRLEPQIVQIAHIVMQMFANSTNSLNAASLFIFTASTQNTALPNILPTSVSPLFLHVSTDASCYRENVQFRNRVTVSNWIERQTPPQRMRCNKRFSILASLVFPSLCLEGACQFVKRTVNLWHWHRVSASLGTLALSF